jgi:hypothetical protein
MQHIPAGNNGATGGFPSWPLLFTAEMIFFAFPVEIRVEIVFSPKKKGLPNLGNPLIFIW